MLTLRSRFLIFIALLFLPLLGSCQGPNDYEIIPELVEQEPGIETTIDIQYEVITYTEIMSFGVLPSHPQGGDCWGDFYFQFVSNNTSVRIYDLVAKQMVQSVPIPSSQRGFVPNCHCNTVCFGNEFYNEDDEFPLIYVSTGYAYDGYAGVIVYRITREQGKFAISLVQTIRIPKDKPSWVEFVPVEDYSYYFYTANWEIYKLPLPKPSEGDVIINNNSAVEYYSFPIPSKKLSSSKNQDTVFYEGRIFFITGVPQNGEFCGLVVLNLETQLLEKVVDFKAIGLRIEPESIFIWKGNLCVAFIDQIVKLDLLIEE